ncbi:hypothetical protein [Oceanibacterium hippocampi]|uniref:Uncharacterized protein n=1 Tax=Oceanibacterium hippocampi TaxID=745714 RepID=A0A1Y5SBQ4_9PROT|nr:hypothetical protein [Oceanibacterium hippocampi]SLN34013.1 hypothetical protein OCH7691_01318 [Oceanibacterium hippocampi]
MNEELSRNEGVRQLDSLADDVRVIARQTRETLTPGQRQLVDETVRSLNKAASALQDVEERQVDRSSLAEAIGTLAAETMKLREGGAGGRVEDIARQLDRLYDRTTRLVGRLLSVGGSQRVP